MQRREVLKTLGCAAGMLFVPSLASDVLARSGRKYHSETWRGFNLLNYFNPDHAEPFNEERFKWISDWGFNFVRLPLSYWAWSRPGEYYQMDARVLDDLDRAVEFGRKHHIHVCLNLHRAPVTASIRLWKSTTSSMTGRLWTVAPINGACWQSATKVSVRATSVSTC